MLITIFITIFKIKLKLYIAPGSVTQVKNSECTYAATGMEPTGTQWRKANYKARLKMTSLL
jgi:hypothetical protein